MSENLPPDVTGGDPMDGAPAAPPQPKRGPGHRGQDIRDTMAEMAAKAHEISLEAGSKMASAMRDVVGAAAGISAFAIESARDLVNYMVRRGQMSQEEATKLLKEVEEAHAKRPKVDIPKRAPEPPARSEIRMLKDPVPAKPERSAAPPSRQPASPPPAAEKPAAKPAAKAAAKAAPAKAASAEKKGAKAPAKAAAKPAAKKTSTKKK
jgi:polyhydroxyalkanoate synthesis regulator phasin